MQTSEGSYKIYIIVVGIPSIHTVTLPRIFQTQSITRKEYELTSYCAVLAIHIGNLMLSRYLGLPFPQSFR